jgi:hypothetical protein
MKIKVIQKYIPCTRNDSNQQGNFSYYKLFEKYRIVEFDTIFIEE